MLHFNSKANIHEGSTGNAAESGTAESPERPPQQGKRLLQSLGENPFYWMIMLDMIIFLWRLGMRGPRIWADSFSYYQAMKLVPAIFHGSVDIVRTPVYPAELALCHFAAGRNYFLNTAVFVQYAVSLFAVILFYQTAKRILPALWMSRTAVAVFIAAVFYFFRLTVIRFDFWIGTESFAVSGVIFYTCLLISYSRSPSFLKAVSLGLGLLVLIMLRPVFAVYLPLMIFFFFAQTVFRRQRRKYGAAGLTAAVLTLTVVLLYSYGVWKKCGVFSLSIVSVWNYRDCVVQTGLYRYGVDANINQMFDECLKQYASQYPAAAAQPEFLLRAQAWKWGELCDERSPLVYCRKHVPAFSPNRSGGITADLQRWNNYALGTIKANKLRYLQRSAQKFFYWVQSSAVNAAGLLLTCFSAAVLLFSRRRVPVQETFLHGVLLLGAAVLYAVVFTSAMDDYERLTLPATPLLFLSWLAAAERIRQRYFISGGLHHAAS